MRSIALAALVSSVLACAHAAPVRLIVHSQVSVVVLPSPDELPFDPSDARLAEASAQLSALVGHPFVFEFDVALLPDWRADFQQMLIESIENVARDFDRLAHEEPRVFSHGAALIERVVSRYDVQVAHRPEWKLDPAARVLLLSGPATHWGIERGYVEAALQDEYARWADGRWGGARAQDVAPADRPAYFEFLTDSRVRAAWTKRHRGQAETVPRAPDVEAVLGCVELSSVLGASSPQLARDVRAWLVRQAQELAGAYNGEEDRVVALPASSPWHRAEAAWVAWANAQLGTMSDEEKLALADSVFVRTRGPDGVFRASPAAFPGFDRFAFGMSVADSWARAGHPRGGAQAEAQRALVETIVCPRTVSADGTESRSSRCDYVWYRDALESAATTRRLTDALLARKDRDLVQTAFSALTAMPSGGDKLALLLSLVHALEGDDLAWTEAFHVVADELAEGGDPARWVDEARRAWRPHAPRRGALLYALAQVDRYGDNDKVGWSRFGETFGAPLGAAELAAYLDQGARAWSLARVVWPALSQGWSRAAVFLPRLDAYLADPRVRRYDVQDPGHAIRAIAAKLCDEGNVADMALMAAAFRSRAATYPGATYASIFEDRSECAKHGTAPPSARKPLMVPSP
jgi:hypothetical protein